MATGVDLEEVQSDMERIVHRSPLKNLVLIAKDVTLNQEELIYLPYLIRRRIAETFHAIDNTEQRITLFAKLY